MELTGKVTRLEEDKVTISLGPLVTVDIEHVRRLVESYVAPKRRRRLSITPRDENKPGTRQICGFDLEFLCPRLRPRYGRQARHGPGIGLGAGIGMAIAG